MQNMIYNDIVDLIACMSAMYYNSSKLNSDI